MLKKDVWKTGSPDSWPRKEHRKRGRNIGWKRGTECHSAQMGRHFAPMSDFWRPRPCMAKEEFWTFHDLLADRTLIGTQ